MATLSKKSYPLPEVEGYGQGVNSHESQGLKAQNDLLQGVGSWADGRAEEAHRPRETAGSNNGPPHEPAFSQQIGNGNDPMGRFLEESPRDSSQVLLWLGQRNNSGK